MTDAMLLPAEAIDGTPAVTIDMFGDPGCPFDYGSEPLRLQLAWHYGRQLAARFHVIVLSSTREQLEEKGTTPEKQARGFAKLEAKFGMPYAEGVRERVPTTLPACTAVVAVRRHAPAAEPRFLRELRRAYMAVPGALLDDPMVVVRAAAASGLDADEVADWVAEPETPAQVRADMEAARSPLPAARALDHKMADSESGGRRYSAPTMVMHGADGGELVAVGRQPIETYDVMVANLAPGIERRGTAESAREVLEWAGMPLATREVAVIRGIDDDAAREELEEAGASSEPVGQSAWWTLS